MVSRSEVIDLVGELVKFDTSINPELGLFPSGECAEYVINYGRTHGYSVLDMGERWYERGGKKLAEVFPVVLYKKGSEPGPTILHLGHIDVVPVTEAELPSWRHEPFNPIVEGDLLFGRGSGDMKGGVAAFLLAFKEFEVNKGTIIIALSGDEEVGGTASMPPVIDKLKEEGMTPDYVINAEGAFEQVIVTKRRGGTQIEFEFNLDYDKVVGEAKTIEFQSAHPDGSQSLHSMSFILGADIHAMIAAGKFSMDKPIISASSSSVKSNSAPQTVNIAYVDILSDNKSEIRYSKGLTGMMHALASIGSLPWPIVPSKFGPSVNPNLIDFDESNNKAKITFDIRSMLKSTESHEEMKLMMVDHFKSYGVDTKATITLGIDTVNVDPQSDFPQLLLKIATDEGFEIITVGEKLGGASDTRFFTSEGIPGIELGPIAHNSHGTNEAVELSSIEKLIIIYQKLYQELVK